MSLEDCSMDNVNSATRGKGLPDKGIRVLGIREKERQVEIGREKGALPAEKIPGDNSEYYFQGIRWR